MATGRNRAGVATVRKAQNIASGIDNRSRTVDVSELVSNPVTAGRLPHDRPVRPWVHSYPWPQVPSKGSSPPPSPSCRDPSYRPQALVQHSPASRCLPPHAPGYRWSRARGREPGPPSWSFDRSSVILPIHSRSLPIPDRRRCSSTLWRSSRCTAAARRSKSYGHICPSLARPAGLSDGGTTDC